MGCIYFGTSIIIIYLSIVIWIYILFVAHFNLLKYFPMDKDFSMYFFQWLHATKYIKDLHILKLIKINIKDILFILHSNLLELLPIDMYLLCVLIFFNSFHIIMCFQMKQNSPHFKINLRWGIQRKTNKIVQSSYSTQY